MDKHLHIVTHDVPWPPDYGGVIDLFNKIKVLHKLGIKIHLHCFYAKRLKQEELDQYCESVTYYRRKAGMAALSFSVPYIVKSRSNHLLLKNLLRDSHPVLLEGIHCTYFLSQNKLPGRKIFVRLHNTEYKYYHNLAKNEINIFKRIYFSRESRLLKKFEKKLAGQAFFLAVSESDISLYKNEFNAKRIEFLPVFLPWEQIKGFAGTGCYCLYHGNLSINENEKAVEWLLNKVFKNLNIAVVVAGKNPSAHLQKICRDNPQTCIVINPAENELDDLIRKAQVNILPSLNETGVKLKLLNALYNGRHCLVNRAGVEGTGLENLCNLSETPEQFREKIIQLFNTPFTTADVEGRNIILQDLYNAEKNGAKLIAWIY